MTCRCVDVIGIVQNVLKTQAAGNGKKCVNLTLIDEWYDFLLTIYDAVITLFLIQHIVGLTLLFSTPYSNFSGHEMDFTLWETYAT